MAASNATADMPGSLKLLACDARMRSMHHFLLSSKRGESFNLHTWPHHMDQSSVKTSIMHFYEAYTKTIQAGIVPLLTETRGLAGPLVIDIGFRFPGDVEDH